MRCKEYGWAPACWKPIVLVLALLFLGGCAEWAARLIEDAAYLHQSGRAYVMEIHDRRRDIRRECWASVMREADSMRRDGGDEAAFRAMMASHYPGLVTVDLIKAAREDTANVLSRAPGCE